MFAILVLFTGPSLGRPLLSPEERSQPPYVEREVPRAVEYAPPVGAGDHCLNAPDVIAGT